VNHQSTWFYTDIVGAVRITSVATVLQQLEDYLAIASSLGAELIAIPPGEAWPTLGIEEGHAIYRKVFAELLPLAEHYAVTIGLGIGRASGTFSTPRYALRLVEELASPWLTVIPDFEAWRLVTHDLPIGHVERPNTTASLPTF
jgi:sugar phosphate isomerase/epimerase